MVTLTLMAVAALSQGPDFNWSGELGAGKRLSIRNIAGDIRIEPAAGAAASVTGLKRPGRRGDPAAVEIRRVETSDGITICVVDPGSRGGDRDCEGGRRREAGRWEENDTRVDFTVRLPAGAALSAMTVSGDVTGSGLRGPTEARSVSGDVRLSDVSGATVEARTVSGDVALTGVGADEVTAETVSGDVEFSGEIRPGGDYDLKTLSGDLVLRIPKDASARITGATFSGDFSSSFPLTARETSRYTRQQRIDGTIGEGSARIRVESFSGDVAIRTLEGPS